MEFSNELIDECKQILIEYGFASRWDYISGYHALGGRIVTDNGLLDKRCNYGEETIKNLSTAIGVSERNLQYAVQFYKKFPDLDMLPAGKNISWSKIVREFLPSEPTKRTPKEKRCPHCGGLL